MKKFLAVLATALAATLALSGCGGGASKLALGTYWTSGNSIGGDGVVPIDETYTYSVKKIEPTEKNPILSVEYGEDATLTMHVERVHKPGSDALLSGLAEVPDGGYFRLTTDLTGMSGVYHYTPAKGESEDVSFADEGIHSVVYFKGVLDSLMPVWSQKTIVSTSPIGNGISASSASYRFVKMAYRVTSVYADRATVTVEVDEENCSEDGKSYLSPILGEHTYKKYAKNATFFDADQFLFACRSLTFADSLSGTFRTVDVSADLSSAIRISISAPSKAQKQIVGLSIDWNGSTVDEVTAWELRFSSSKGGARQTAFYAGPDQRGMLIQYVAPISDRLGSLEYTLESYKVNG